MSERETVLTPVGRLVQGSLYDPQTKTMDGKPLTTRAGEPRVDYYFALAIPKGSETHWNQTPWGAKIFALGQRSFPNGQWQQATFAWKVKDGDSTQINKANRRWCDYEGYAGHWIINFSSGYAPKVLNKDGSQQLLEKDHVNPGDYIQVFGNMISNESTQQPGLLINHSMVAFYGFGKPILAGIDPKSVGFGQEAMPAGASPVPVATGFNPQAAPAPSVSQPAPASISQSTPAPYYNVLSPPAPPVMQAPAAPARVMLPAAQGATYEQLTAVGWTDALLIQHGMMQG